MRRDSVMDSPADNRDAAEKGGAEKSDGEWMDPEPFAGLSRE